MDDRGLRGLPPVHAVIQGLEGYPPSVAREAAREGVWRGQEQGSGRRGLPHPGGPVAAAAERAGSAVASTMARW
jgi:hypothetical protein